MPLNALLRLSALVAMAASAALFMHYIDPVEASFCAAESGCEAVRRSPFSYFGSPVLNLPLMGLVAYAAVFTASVMAPRERLAPWLAIAGGVGGAGFLALQAAYVGAFCWLCVIVDGAALAAALFGILRLRREPGPELVKPGAWGALAVVAVIAAPLWSRVRPAPPVPPVVRALYAPGKINVVEFADFECPFCRRLHPVLKQALGELGQGEVHFVRMNVPLPSHEHAAGLAAAYVCADEQGKGEAAADILMEADPGPYAVDLAIKRTGLDRARFEACLDAESTTRRIEAETQVLRDAGMLGLPTTYIGPKRFVGSVSIEAVRDALRRAGSGEGDRGVPLPAYLAVVLAAVGGIAWFGRARGEP